MAYQKGYTIWSKMVKYVPFSCFKVYLELELGSKDFISISTLTLVKVKEKKGGGSSCSSTSWWLSSKSTPANSMDSHDRCLWLRSFLVLNVEQNVEILFTRFSDSGLLRDETFATSALGVPTLLLCGRIFRVQPLAMTVRSIAPELQLVCYIRELVKGFIWPSR